MMESRLNFLLPAMNWRDVRKIISEAHKKIAGLHGESMRLSRGGNYIIKRENEISISTKYINMIYNIKAHLNSVAMEIESFNNMHKSASIHSHCKLAQQFLFATLGSYLCRPF